MILTQLRYKDKCPGQDSNLRLPAYFPDLTG